MQRKMRQFGIVATSIGVIIGGLLPVQVMGDPKARTALPKWVFTPMALLGGMGVYAVSFTLSTPWRSGGEDSSPRAS